MYELKKISIASAARAGVFFGVTAYLVFMAIAVATKAVKLDMQTGLLTVVVGISVAVTFSFLLGGLLAWIYNLSAKTWGGLRIDFHFIDEDEKDDSNDEEDLENKDS